MKQINTQNLKKLINYYYQTNCDILPSWNYISKELDMTLAETRTLLKYFELCNFIYNGGISYHIFTTKRNFTKFTKIVDKGSHLVYSSPDYVISLNKFEMKTLEPNFKIETIEDLIYMLFLFTINSNVLIHPRIYWKNNELWYKKECRSFKDNSVLFMCKFTQHSNEINLINI